ncbi:MAG TPA: DUF1559 domain-containing protein [Capsulimonadaceae bacterium]|jgi:prepilin-type N-terminal cleavage/methylation domain-containing protein/prepilin-type processing-associated H-X9-DG protein
MQLLRRTPTLTRVIRGFTLIELLVVIAIISLLTAILFPVFASAREKARQTQCASNLRQIGLCVAQYVQDYDDFYPYGEIWSTMSSSPAAWYPYANWCVNANLMPCWIDLVFPYTKTNAIFYCPDPPQGRLWATLPYCGAAGTMIGNPNEPGYASNPNVFRELLWSDSTFDNTTGKCIGGQTVCYQTQNAAKITRPTEIALMADRGQADRFSLPSLGSNTWSASMSDPNGSWSGKSPASTQFGTNPDWKHLGFANFLFVDGHVKARKFSSDEDVKYMVGDIPYGL